MNIIISHSLLVNEHLSGLNTSPAIENRRSTGALDYLALSAGTGRLVWIVLGTFAGDFSKS